MPQTRKPSVLSNYLRDLAASTRIQTGFQTIHYGDQRIIGAVPALCVEPAVRDRAYVGTAQRVENTFQIACIIYHGGEDNADKVQEQCDVITETWIDIVNKAGMTPTYGGDQWGGLIMDCLDSSGEYGYEVKADQLLRANRVIFSVRTRTDLTDFS